MLLLSDEDAFHRHTTYIYRYIHIQVCFVAAFFLSFWSPLPPTSVTIHLSYLQWTDETARRKKSSQAWTCRDDEDDDDVSPRPAPAAEEEEDGDDDLPSPPLCCCLACSNSSMTFLLRLVSRANRKALAA